MRRKQQQGDLVLWMTCWVIRDKSLSLNTTSLHVTLQYSMFLEQMKSVSMLDVIKNAKMNMG